MVLALTAGLLGLATTAALAQAGSATPEENALIKSLSDRGTTGGKKKGAAFAKDNKWTDVCLDEFENKFIRSAGELSDTARAAVEDLLRDMDLDAAKEFGKGGKVFNWFINRNNAFVCESCSTFCSSEALYRKHLCMGLCEGGRKVLFDAENMLKFTSAGMPGKKKMAEKHKLLSDVLEKHVLEAKEKKKK